jgi:hypothetical protein
MEHVFVCYMLRTCSLHLEEKHAKSLQALFWLLQEFSAHCLARLTCKNPSNSIVHVSWLPPTFRFHPRAFILLTSRSKEG